MRGTCLLAAILLAAPVSAQEAKAPEHQVRVDLRYRFETVDQPSFDDDARASTLRTALSYRSPEWKGWSLFLEAENVAAVPDDSGYNNAGRGDDSNRIFDRPVVADPALTEMNQAHLRWSHDEVTVTLGRQEINLGDQRFVGAVGWRQNHQSFDAVRLEWRATPRIDVDYAYLTDVHRIFGDRLDADHHLLTVPIRWGQEAAELRPRETGAGGTVTVYGYRLDWDPILTTLSTLTAGVEWRGAAGRWHWELEAARQEDAGSNRIDSEAGYLHGEVGVGWSAGSENQGTDLGVAVDWERLEGGTDGRFQTPLATLHKFNGWADLFLNTPAAGLETTTLRFTGSFTGKSGPWSWLLAYLDHRAEAASVDYGTEIDGQLTWKSGWRQTFALKLASYDADLFGQDTDKIMLFTTYGFGG